MQSSLRSKDVKNAIQCLCLNSDNLEEVIDMCYNNKKKEIRFMKLWKCIGLNEAEIIDSIS